MVRLWGCCATFFLFLPLVWGTEAPSRSSPQVTEREVTRRVQGVLGNNSELVFLRSAAKRLGVNVYLRSHTAASLSFYARNAVEAETKGRIRSSPLRFDDHFASVFPYENPLPFQVSFEGAPGAVEQLRRNLAQRLPFATVQEFPVPKASADLDWIRLTDGQMARELTGSVLSGRVTKVGSLPVRPGSPGNVDLAIDHLISASRFGLELSPEVRQFVRKSLSELDPKHLARPEAMAAFQKHALKIFETSGNLEFTYKMLGELDPDKRLALLGVDGRLSSGTRLDLAVAYNKVVLPAQPIPKKRFFDLKKTAADLGIDLVNHQVRSLEVLSAITRSPHGDPLAYISGSEDTRSMEVGRRGVGFYTNRGASNLWYGSEYPYAIVFRVNPDARNGVDFFTYGDEVIFKNAAALKIVEPTRAYGPIEFFEGLGSKRSHEELLDMYRQHWRITVDLADPNNSEKVHRIARELFAKASDIRDINRRFLNEYYKLPADNSAAREAHDLLAARIKESLQTAPAETERFYELWARSEHSKRYPAVVSFHLNHPRFNGGSYLSANFMPYVLSPLQDEKWFVDMVRKSPEYSMIQKFLGNTPSGTEFLRKLGQPSADCRQGAVELLLK